MGRFLIVVVGAHIERDGGCKKSKVCLSVKYDSPCLLIATNHLCLLRETGESGLNYDSNWTC